MTKTERLTAAIRAAKEAGEWNQTSSVDFILDLVADETGTKPDKEFAEMVNMVVNPSAFRQKLEKAGVLPESVKGIRKSNSALSAALALAK